MLWFAFGYSMCFGPTIGGIIGNPTTYAFLHGISLNTMSPATTRSRCSCHVAYQMMFAIITPALITGAFANRVTFKAYLLFLTGLADLRLLPVRAHDLGRRPLGQVGRAGFRGRHRRAQHRRLRGAGLGALSSDAGGSSSTGRITSRWSRWAPGCCGLAGMASTPASRAARRCRDGARRSSTPMSRRPSRRSTWLVDRLDANAKQPKFVGLLTGSVAGLATITPAAGYVSPTRRGRSSASSPASSATTRWR